MMPSGEWSSQILSGAGEASGSPRQRPFPLPGQAIIPVVPLFFHGQGTRFALMVEFHNIPDFLRTRRTEPAGEG